MFPKKENYETDYYEEINTDNYELNINIDNNKIDYYSCSNNNNRSYNGTDVDCSEDNTNFWIHWTGTSSNRWNKNVILKLIITWQYDEYEY